MAGHALSSRLPPWFHRQRLLLLLHRPFSASAAQESAQLPAPNKPKHRKKKTFFQVAQFLADWGIGSKFTKSHWPSGNFYQITDVRVYKDGRHGAAWGIFHNQGSPATGKAEKIGSVNKHCWKYIEETTKSWKRVEVVHAQVSEATP